MLDLEKKFWAQGAKLVAGADEAGRGALAGPLVAGAVILPTGLRAQGLWGKVKDSKALQEQTRRKLYKFIIKNCLSCAIFCVSASEIDRRGIAWANKKALAQALASLSPAPQKIIIDYVKFTRTFAPSISLARADSLSLSVACASVLAKVYRDNLLVALERKFPRYGFARHKGYGTPEHIANIQKLGVLPVHRATFCRRWVKN